MLELLLILQETRNIIALIIDPDLDQQTKDKETKYKVEF